MFKRAEDKPSLEEKDFECLMKVKGKQPVLNSCHPT